MRRWMLTGERQWRPWLLCDGMRCDAMRWCGDGGCWWKKELSAASLLCCPPPLLRPHRPCLYPARIASRASKEGGYQAIHPTRGYSNTAVASHRIDVVITGMSEYRDALQPLTQSASARQSTKILKELVRGIALTAIRILMLVCSCARVLMMMLCCAACQLCRPRSSSIRASSPRPPFSMVQLHHRQRCRPARRRPRPRPATPRAA